MRATMRLWKFVKTIMQIGAKLTGGGAGGCCISLSKTKENALEIQNALKEKGYSSWIVTV